MGLNLIQFGFLKPVLNVTDKVTTTHPVPFHPFLTVTVPRISKITSLLCD